VPHRVIETYQEAAPTAQHHVIKGATHRLDRKEWKAAFLAHILTWFEGLAESPRPIR
jgi:hypothetical protein